MIPFLCRFGWHQWPKWSEKRGATVEGHETQGIAIQDRICSGCNRHEFRIVRATNE